MGGVDVSILQTNLVSMVMWEGGLIMEVESWRDLPGWLENEHATVPKYCQWHALTRRHC